MNDFLIGYQIDDYHWQYNEEIENSKENNF